MGEAEQQLDGSALCLSCGMCCRGMLHGWAKLDPDEWEMAARAGLDVFEGESGPAFRLPCPRLNGNACEIYGHRPSTCSGYRCGLLEKYLSGAVSLDEAVATAAEAKRLAAEVRELAGPEPFPALRERWRRGLASFLSGEAAAAEREQRAYLMLSALNAYLDRYMVAPREPGLLDKSQGPLEKREIGG